MPNLSFSPRTLGTSQVWQRVRTHTLALMLDGMFALPLRYTRLGNWLPALLFRQTDDEFLYNYFTCTPFPLKGTLALEHIASLEKLLSMATLGPDPTSK